MCVHSAKGGQYDFTFFAKDNEKANFSGARKGNTGSASKYVLCMLNSTLN